MSEERQRKREKENVLFFLSFFISIFLSPFFAVSLNSLFLFLMLSKNIYK